MITEPSKRYVVVVRVATDCTLGCQFCGFSRELQKPSRTISWSVLETLGTNLRRFQQTHHREVLVAWLGGEPLHWKDWKRASQVFACECGLELGITTNGLALRSASIRQFILKHFRELTISVDGLEQHHDELRQRPGMFRELKTVVQKLNENRDRAKLLLRVNTVLMRRNIGEFREFCQTMADWGFDEITFNQLGGNDRPEFYTDNRLLPEQIVEFASALPRLRHELAQQNVRLQGTENYLKRMLASALDERIAVDDCCPGEDFLFVDERGRVSPCSFTSLDFLNCSLHADSIENLPRLFRETRKRQRPGSCDDCHATQVSGKFASQMVELLQITDN